MELGRAGKNGSLSKVGGIGFPLQSKPADIHCRLRAALIHRLSTRLLLRQEGLVAEW